MERKSTLVIGIGLGRWDTCSRSFPPHPRAEFRSDTLDGGKKGDGFHSPALRYVTLDSRPRLPPIVFHPSRLD
jgi:hypothetical protein